MRRGVMTQVNFVAGLADRLPIAHDHAANRVFPGFRFAFPGKGDCPLHPVSIRFIPTHRPNHIVVPLKTPMAFKT
jgi:hypothetical protein